jgi:hypothetical protein
MMSSSSGTAARAAYPAPNSWSSRWALTMTSGTPARPASTDIRREKRSFAASPRGSAALAA